MLSTKNRLRKNDTLRLVRIIVVVSVAYFGSFLWVVNNGHVGLGLLSPANWQFIFETRAINHLLGGAADFYGVSPQDLFVRWIAMIATVSGAYLGYLWVAGTREPHQTPPT